MITKLGTFDRALTAGLKTQMTDAARQEGGWFREVLADPGLILALRVASANVYFKGQSVFKITAGATALRATTHEKYLLDPKLGGQIAFDGLHFDVAALRNKVFVESWVPKTSIRRIKQAAEVYSGKEKAGCHVAAIGNPDVIDVEIALPGSITVEGDEPGKDVTTPRIDLLSLQPDGSGAPHPRSRPARSRTAAAERGAPDRARPSA